MSRRVLVSTLGACALLVSGVAGSPAATALAVDGPEAPTSVAFGTVKLFETKTEPVTVSVPLASAAVTFPVGAATVQPNDDDFVVDADACSDTTVQPGGTCIVTVTFNPLTGPGPRTADLVIESSSPAISVALSGTAAQDATGTFYGITPTRFIDTRKSGSKQPLARNSTTTLQIGGRSTIPTAGVSAVVVNLTAVTTTSQGYFTLYPSDKGRPTASSINFPKAWTGANMVTVPVSPDGKVKLYNYGGAAHAIVDVLGWYAENDSVQLAKGMGASFVTTETGDAERRYDSRQDTAGAFFGGDAIQFEDTWGTSAEATSIKSYVVNVTAVDATSSGVLTLWQGGSSPKPTVSTVNYVKGTIAPNMAVVPAGHYSSVTTGFKLQNTGSGEVHVVVDLVGYYIPDYSVAGQLNGLRFVPRDTPKRLVDTRKPVGSGTVLSGAFGTTARTVNATSVSTGDSGFVIANTTGILPTRRTYLTVWSGEAARPSASNINVNPGVVRSASTYAPLQSTAPLFKIYNNAGSMHVVLDVAGTFDVYPASTPAAAAARVERSDGAGGADASGTTARRDLPTVGDSQRSTVRR